MFVISNNGPYDAQGDYPESLAGSFHFYISRKPCAGAAPPS